MARPPGRVLVVGGGVAGARCAEALRAGGFAGAIVLTGDEGRGPYDRTALSKGLLDGTRTAPSLALRPRGHWRSLGVDLRTGWTVVDIDPERRRATTAAGAEIGWDALVLATGARPRRLGAGNGAAHVLRTASDGRRLRQGLGAGRRLVVIGGGFLALEVASSAAGLGVDVTVVAGPAGPLAGQLGGEVASLVATRARAAGVWLVPSVARAVLRVDPATAAVTLAGGAELPCDVVLQAIGAAPSAGLLAPHLTLAADGGVPVDAAGRTTIAGVYACGDAASPWEPSSGAWRANGHWTAAAESGAAVGRGLLGLPPAPAQAAYSWSDVFGLRLQCVGEPSADADVELDLDGDGFKACYRRDGRLVGAVLGNRPAAVAALRRALAPGGSGAARRVAA